MSLALYRKYRSLTFAELIGQEHIAATLRNQVRRGEVAHAYLFAGIRGTGKTSAARILARAVTCLAPQDGEPDNSCVACKEVLSGAAVDVLEIDGASNRGIDEMRDLREKVKFLPASLKRKVYIVDEAHMLTEPAWNAFLKTLEEPPPHVLFVLATTEPHKVPETVRSRVQRFDFRRVPTPAIAAHLAAVCRNEGAAAEADALELVAEAGQGSVRDALSVLDQALATGERPLTEATVRRALGLADPATLRQVMLGIATGNPGASMRGAAAAFDAGADARQLLREMARLARGAELTALGHPDAAELTATDAALCAEMASTGRRGIWVEAIDRFSEAEINLRQPVDSRLQVELALLRLTEGGGGLAERVERLEAALGGGAVQPSPSAPPAAPPVSPVPRLSVPRAPAPGGALPVQPPPVAPAMESPRPAPEPASDASSSLDAWNGRWSAIVDAVHKRDVMLAGILRDCKPLEGDDDRLVIGVPFGWHLERIADQQKRRLLTEVVSSVVNRTCEVEPRFTGPEASRASVPGGARAHQAAPDAEPEAPDATSVVISTFPGARLTGSVLRDSRSDLAP